MTMEYPILKTGGTGEFNPQYVKTRFLLNICHVEQLSTFR